MAGFYADIHKKLKLINDFIHILQKTLNYSFEQYL